jgi:hypothetical protein
MPSHDITREFIPILKDPFSFTASARFIRCFFSIKIVSLCLGTVLCNSKKFYFSLMASMRFIRFFLDIKITVFYSFSAGELLVFSFLLSLSYPFSQAHPSLRGFSSISCSFCQKETRVILGLQDLVVLQADILQLDHVFIHGVIPLPKGT